MKHVDGSIPNLLQGVSQQPPRDRQPGQCSIQENMSADAVRGLIRRSPSELQAVLIPSTDPDPLGWVMRHVYVGDLTFIMAYKPGAIRMFGIDGVERTVTATAAAKAYLPDTDIGYVTIGQETFITNPNRVVEMTDELPSYVRGNGLVYLMGGAYSRTYTVTVKHGFTAGVPAFTQTVSHTTPDGSAAEHEAEIATTFIAGKLRDLLVANTSIAEAYNISLASDVILLAPKDGTPTDLSIAVEDGDGGVNLYGISSFIGDAAKLPRFAAPGQLVIVKGVEGDADDWYVQFDQEYPGFGTEGIWRECTVWDEPYKFDLTTMPHVLTYDEDTDSFTFAQGEWKERRVGDDNTVEPPSCVGNTINDLTAFQGRLVMATGSAVLSSRTNRYTDLWPKSATTVVDSDPIDVESSIIQGATMRKLIPHNRDLVVFSDRAQFIVFGRAALTPRNTSLVLTTSFEANLDAAPVSSGRNVFFAMRYGNYTGVREFYTEETIDANNSDSITAHITQYIEGQANQLVTSSNFDLLFVRTPADKKRVYMYQFVFAGQDRAQAAWSRCTFDADVEYMFFRENIVYMVQRDGNTTFLSFLNLDRLPDTGLSYQVHLDRKTDIADVHTTLPRPYAGDIVLVQGQGCPNPGLLAEIESIGTDGVVVLKSDMQGGTVICGIPYLSRWSPTRPYFRDRNGMPVLNGTLHLTKYRAAVQESGKFDVQIVNQYSGTASVPFSGRMLGAAENVIGQPAVMSGEVVVPVRTDAEYSSIIFETSAETPLALAGLEWEGQYTKRGTRV